MYGISTDYKISYIDCLFLCVTSMTVNGLATVDLSTLSVMQQVIMFWQMLIGSLVRPFTSLCPSADRRTGLCLDRHDHRPTVSISPRGGGLCEVLIRRHFFRLKFKHVIMEQRRQEKSLLQRTLSRVATTRTQPLSAIRRRFSTIIRPSSNDQPDQVCFPVPLMLLEER